MSQHELLKNLGELDDLLEKGQIVQGKNSAPKKWAGSEHKEEAIPHNAPDGTNYKPSKDIAHKALHDMSNDEIEQYLAMRKAGQPNLQAALYEIRQIEGVTDSICKSCNGIGKDALRKSTCGDCGGFGVIIDCATADAAYMAKAIADKYNVGPNSEDMDKADEDCEKGHAAGTGGADCDADPTPEYMTPEKKAKVSKGKKKGMDAMMSEDGKGRGYGKMAKDMDADEVEGDEMEGEGEGEEMEMGVKKSILVLEHGMATMLKGLKYLLEKSQEHSDLLSNADMSKSLGSSMPQPAGPPRSAGLSVAVLEKGGSSAPSMGNLSIDDIKKSVSQMALDGLVSPMEVVRLESSVDVHPDLLEQVSAYIQKNGVPKNAMPSAYRQ